MQQMSQTGLLTALEKCSLKYRQKNECAMIVGTLRNKRMGTRTATLKKINPQ